MTMNETFTLNKNDFRTTSNVSAIEVPAEMVIEEAVNVEAEEVGEESVTVYDLTEIDIESVIEYDPAGSSRSSSSMSSRGDARLSPDAKRKKRKLDPADVLDAILSRPTVIPQPPEKPQDDLTQFLLGLGATMKSFKPVRLAGVKLEMATIVGKAEIQNAIELEREESVVMTIPDE